MRSKPTKTGEGFRYIPLMVKSLRRELGDTQEQFAKRMGAVVRTIARWESERPPTGDALRRLATVARQAGLSQLANAFDRARLVDILSEVLPVASVSLLVGITDDKRHPVRPAGDQGYAGSPELLVLWINSEEQHNFVAAAYKAYTNGFRPDSPEREQYLDAMQEFTKKVTLIKAQL